MKNQSVYTGILLVFCASWLAAQKPDVITELDKDNQALNVPRDPPLVAVGDTGRLMFDVSPLDGRGLLAEQTRNALKAILKLTGGALIVHIRAFSAGNGDIRRIPQIVAEVLGNKGRPLPSVSVLQAGALTLDGAQVVLEAVSQGKKVVNKDGLTFVSGEAAEETGAGSTVPLLLGQAMDRLAAKMNGKPALSVTCFVSSLDGAAALQSMIVARFPGAAIDLVQPRRLAWQMEASCEGVARGGGVAVKTAFSGTQLAFGSDAREATLAVQRLDRAMSDAGAAALPNAALIHLYPMSPAMSEVAMKQLRGPAPVARIFVEGVGPESAGFAIDAVAPVP